MRLKLPWLFEIRIRNDTLTVIVREGGRSSIPETSAIESRSRGVLDPPHSRGMTSYGWGGRRGHSRPKNGVASARLAITPFCLDEGKKDGDTRDKPGHDRYS